MGSRVIRYVRDGWTDKSKPYCIPFILTAGGIIISEKIQEMVRKIEDKNRHDQVTCTYVDHEGAVAGFKFVVVGADVAAVDRYGSMYVTRL